MENMARLTSLLVSFAAFFLASNSSLIQASLVQGSSTAGVFLLIGEKGIYTLDLRSSRPACLLLNVSMANRAQMDKALQHGLETCKYTIKSCNIYMIYEFGWIDEQIAAIPRLTADSQCGQGKTGVVTWAARGDNKFGVFCYNASEDISERTTCGPQQSSSSIQTSIPLPSPTVPQKLLPTTQPPSPSTKTATTDSHPTRHTKATKTPERPSFTSASTLPVGKREATGISSSSSSSSLNPASVSHVITSEPSAVTSAFSIFSTRPAGFSASSEPTVGNPTVRPLGDVPTALIVVGIILILLTAAGVAWNYRLNILTVWSGVQQTDDTETEMWKHTDTHTDSDTQSQHQEEEEEDSTRKYSSDITLCVHPQIKMDSSE